MILEGRSVSYWKAGTGELEESNTEISKESVTGGTGNFRGIRYRKYWKRKAHEILKELRTHDILAESGILDTVLEELGTWDTGGEQK